VSVPAEKLKGTVSRQGTKGASQALQQAEARRSRHSDAGSSTGKGEAMTLLLLAQGDSVVAVPEDAPQTPLKTLSFAPCRVTAICASGSGPLGVSLLVGLSNGDAVALDLVANCAHPDARPSNVLVLSALAEGGAKPEPAVVSCAFVPGHSVGLSQVLVAYANGTVALFPVDTPAGEWGADTPLCRPNFGARKAATATVPPFPIRGSTVRLGPASRHHLGAPAPAPGGPPAPAGGSPPRETAGAGHPFRPEAEGGGNASALKTRASPSSTLRGSGVSRLSDPGAQPPDTGALTCAAVSPDGRWLACGFSGGRVLVLESPGLGLVWGYTGYFGAVMCVSWAPDSDVFAVGGQDDLVAVASHSRQVGRAPAPPPPRPRPRPRPRPLTVAAPLRPPRDAPAPRARPPPLATRRGSCAGGRGTGRGCPGPPSTPPRARARGVARREWTHSHT